MIGQAVSVHGVGGHERILPPSCHTGDIIKAAHRAMEQCWTPGHGYMKGGLMLYELEEQGKRQLTLLEACPAPGGQKKKDLMAALDRINDRYGRDTIHYLSQGPANAPWHMQRKLMSKRFTTNFSELLVVRSG